MGFSSIQVCMDSSDWLQGPISDNNDPTGLMDSSSLITTPTGDCEDILTCGRPMIERRLRPQHEQALQCPRCESTHTKFCYYNNYSLTQPRYFCKTCRRYWTKGGTLRNIPVGGGCRKNKKASSNSKKPSTSSSTNTTAVTSPDNITLHRSSLSSPLVVDHTRSRASPTDLQLAFPEQLQFSSIHGPGLFSPANAGYLFGNVGGPSPVEYMGSKYDHGSSYMGSDMGMQNPSHDYHGMCSNVNHHLFGLASNYEHGIDNPGGGISNILESCQRLMMPYDENNHHHHLDIHNHHHHLDIHNHHHHGHDQVDVKPNAKILSLEWHDCNSDAGIRDSLGYNIGGLGPWTGLMNGYGPPATNPLV